jgi:hypothetical protein
MTVRPALLLVAVALVPLVAAAPAAAGSRATVHLRGTAYEFNATAKRLAGAKIRVAELPKVSATVRADGSYDLVVPDRAEVTPYVVAPGYHTIYLQTFTTDGEDLANVNFQTPSDAVYRALAALLDVDLDAAGDPKRCAIVSTFSTRNVRDLDFAGFTGYGAHGVAGATATASPSLGPPIYFNEDVIPDRAQKTSSADGGVIWTEVPDGVYTVRASHPRTRFASFAATCKPGRIVNANPPWGLHELAPPIGAKVSATWTAAGALRSLGVRKLPRDAELRVGCSGRGCPFTKRTIAAKKGGSVDLLAALGSRAARIGPGQTLEVGAFAHAFDGSLTRYGIRAGATPKPVTLCVPLGNARPRARCP